MNGKHCVLILFILNHIGPLNGHSIVIDPGHGGIYTGCRSASGLLLEKDVALDIAKMVSSLLTKKGYLVVMTRTTDTQLDKHDLLQDLALRADVAQKNSADILVSIHLNGIQNKTMRGFEVYVPYEAKYPQKSYRLASAVHYALSQAVKPEFTAGTLKNVNILDRGIKASRFNVLKKAPCAAILVELDYLTNPDSEKALAKKEYRQQLAQAVYAGINRYFKERER